MRIYNKLETTINQKVIEQINYLLYKKHLSQQKLAELTSIAQPTISKLLKGDANFSLNQLIRISEALNENLFNTIAASDFTQPKPNSDNTILSLEETDNIILNTDRPAFKGYLNMQYYTYFLSTVSGTSEIINGEILFTSTLSKRCKVDFKLYTGKKDILNNDIVKSYTGNMFISIPLATCYCILKNEEMGELSFLNFHHMFLLNEPMRCRACSVLTTCSGENRRPTVHRMIISQYKFDINDINDKTFLLGQLKMNNKKILIKNKDFKEITSSLPYKHLDFSTIDSTIIDLDENSILGLDIDITDKIKLINKLRAASLADRTNKISTNTDEFLYSYICSKLNNN